MNKLYIISLILFSNLISISIINAQNNSENKESYRGTNENINIENNEFLNKSINELITERALALENGQSVLDFDYIIETLLNNGFTNTNQYTGNTKAAPANDNCNNAVTLTIGDPLLCSQTTNSASLQSGESRCGSGGTPETVWYRFTAVNDSVVLSFIETNSPSCEPYVGVFGPFSSGTGCLPTMGENVMCQSMGSADAGLHKLITDLTIGQTYLIQVEGRNCNSIRYTNFCIGVANPLLNTTASGASVIDGCGSGFIGNTSLGNFPSGASSWNNNLDFNTSTTVSGASQTGDDVTYHINNDSWFYFSPIKDGTWQISITGISDCHLPGPNNGIQSSIFTGTPSNLTNIYNFPSPMLPGSLNTSSVFSAVAGQLVYILVDGWAGDACDYTLTLTNITGECAVLPVELISFKAIEKDKKIELKWITASETNNDYFTVLKSTDGENFKDLYNISGAGNSSTNNEYVINDNEPLNKLVYYKLKQTDYDGKYSFSEVISFYSTSLNSISDLNVSWSSQYHEISLNFIGVNNMKYEILLSDITGRNINNLQEIVEQDERVSFKLPTNNLQKGIYQVTVVSNNNKESRKLVVW